MNYWLLKSEADVYSIDDMKSERTTLWENVRNYQARNYMMNEMKAGDLAFFYHSNSKPSAIVGLVSVSGKAVADPTQFDSSSEYFDSKSTREKPRWFCVPVQFERQFKNPISLEQIKGVKSLSQMVLLNNSRLSVQPVRTNEFKTLMKMAKED